MKGERTSKLGQSTLSEPSSVFCVPDFCLTSLKETVEWAVSVQWGYRREEDR